jgi:hypothetical protein
MLDTCAAALCPCSPRWDAEHFSGATVAAEARRRAVAVIITCSLILVTDGITGRRVEGGDTFGVDGIRQALADVTNPTAAAMAILQAVTDCWRESLEDDRSSVPTSQSPPQHAR